MGYGMNIMCINLTKFHQYLKRRNYSKFNKMFSNDSVDFTCIWGQPRAVVSILEIRVAEFKGVINIHFQINKITIFYTFLRVVNYKKKIGLTTL